MTEDVPRGWEENLRTFLKDDAGAQPASTATLLAKNEIALGAPEGTSRHWDAETLLSYGVTGPPSARGRQPVGPAQGDAVLLLRGLRLQDPGRDREATTGIASRCDSPRSTSRWKIIQQALDGLPEGSHIADDRKVVLPPRRPLATSMEALIHHFKLVTEGYRVPPGEVYYPIEGPRGELGCFVRSDGSSKPARVHMRDPSIREPPGLRPPWFKGAYIADVIATLAMLDPILGGIDR